MQKNANALSSIILKELSAVFDGSLADDDVTAAKQYALGRYQRSGQTVGGTAAGYSNRYFFDDEIQDYYKLTERIKAVSRNRIVSVASEMFSEDTWGIGVLGNVNEKFATDMQDRLKQLWSK